MFVPRMIPDIGLLFTSTAYAEIALFDEMAVPEIVNENFGVVTSFVGMTTVAVLAPAALGEKANVQVELCPAAIVTGGSVFSVKVAASVPVPIVNVMPERFIARSVFPELVSVRMIVLLLPTDVPENARLPPELKLVPDA
jgi:hypothetical protein